MDANLIHDIIFYVMYAALAIAVVILVERGLYFSWAQRQALRFEIGRASCRERVSSPV